ncbi:MAG TPA: RIP metalloprotease RseP [Terracidiphilus sp.]|jgi:regulator of sigma E protease|nr:RIP metalloprotease RseP [Terracidiphilus sp.]
MQDLHTIVVAIIAFIVLIGVMVVVHEFGHFAVAKLCGVRVESFSVGFGPRLFGVKRGDTDYKVCLLPLGGYVKMTGESPEQNLQAPGTPVAQQILEGGAGKAAESAGSADYDPGSFTNHPRWQRMLIGLAGPVANFILAFVLMAFYYAFINEVPQHQVTSANVEWVVPDSPAAQAGFKTGDVIKSFDGVRNPDWMQVGNQAQLNLNQNVAVTVDRDGKTIPLTLHIPSLPRGEDAVDISDAGIEPQFMPGPISVYDVSPGTPADQAGLKAGDLIVSVDGQQFHYVGTLQAYMKALPGKTLKLDVQRGGQHVTLNATPAKQPDASYRLGFEAIKPPMRRDPQPMGVAITKSKAFCVDNSTLIVEVLGRLFTRQVAVSQLSGPVGIARMAGEAASMDGYQPKFGLAAAISINLGILNLMPFPILDGGLILLLLIESVLRHDISIHVKERIYQAAFVVLVVFFAFIIFNDVSKLPAFNHLHP